MRSKRNIQQNQALKRAIIELQHLIKKQYPDVVFVVSQGEDPEGIYITAVVDVEDTDEVVDVFIDRLLELQVDERLPLYVIPVRPLKTVIEAMHAKEKQTYSPHTNFHVSA